MTSELNRRDFIKQAAAVTAATSISMAGISTDKVLGANDRIRLGLIGAGRQGVDNMTHFIRQGVEVVGVADVYEPNLQKGLHAAGGKAQSYKDFRQLLDDKTIDVVINGSEIARLSCAGFRPGVAGWKVPRSGYIGFALHEVQLEEGDQVEHGVIPLNR